MTGVHSSIAFGVVHLPRKVGPRALQAFSPLKGLLIVSITIREGWWLELRIEMRHFQSIDAIVMRIFMLGNSDLRVKLFHSAWAIIIILLRSPTLDSSIFWKSLVWSWINDFKRPVLWCLLSHNNMNIVKMEKSPIRHHREVKNPGKHSKEKANLSTSLLQVPRNTNKPTSSRFKVQADKY